MNLSARYSKPLAEQNKAGKTVMDAIQAADLANKGAKFAPFILKIAKAGQFDSIWTSERGDTPIEFFRFKTSSDTKFLPLGDIALVRGANLNSRSPFLIGSDQTDVLAHPTGFQQLMDDHGSRNDRMVDYWWPIAPDGYVALGLCFTNSEETKPIAANYWCVKSDYLRVASAYADFWDDSNSHWTDNGSLRTPAIAAGTAPMSGEVLVIPTTVLSKRFGQAGYLLAGEQCLLDVAPLPSPVPEYVEGAVQGSTTSEVLRKIAVLPYTAVSDPGYLNQAVNSPFYYAANYAGWACYSSKSSPEGGSEEVAFEIGTAESVSQAFKQKTSLTIGANVGFAAEGLSAGINTSYTETFEYSTGSSSGRSSQSATRTTINFPKTDILWLWQRFANVAVYRTTGQHLSSAVYSMSDHRIVTTPVKDGKSPAKEKSLAGALN